MRLIGALRRYKNTIFSQLHLNIYKKNSRQILFYGDSFVFLPKLYYIVISHLKQTSN